MLKISKQQVNSRYDSMSQNLKEFLFSEINSNLLLAIGEAHHLTDDKKSDLATIVGDVVFGFIHPDDLSKHIVADLNIDSRLAQTLADEIGNKIFSPVMQELRQNYRAVGSEAPMFVSDISKPAQSDSEVIYAEFEPRVDLKKEPGEKELGNFFAQLNGNSSPDQQQTIVEAAPTIIHEEAEIKQITKAKSSFGGLMGIFKGTGEKKPQAQAVAAEVQYANQQPITNQPETRPIRSSGRRQGLGGNQQQETIKNIVESKKDIQDSNLRVVHYSDLKTSLPNLQPTTNNLQQKSKEEKENAILPAVINEIKSPINVMSVIEKKEDLKGEINLDHFGGHLEKTEASIAQPEKNENQWKPGGVFSFLKRNKPANVAATNSSFGPTEQNNEKIENKGGIPETSSGQALSEVNNLNVLKQDEISRKAQNQPDLIVRTNDAIQQAQKINSVKIEDAISNEAKNPEKIQPASHDQPKIINLDEVGTAKEPYKSSLNGQQHKIGKEELVKLKTDEKAVNLADIGKEKIINELAPADLSQNKSRSESAAVNLDNGKKAGGFFGFFGFFKKKPKLVEVDLNLVDKTNNIKFRNDSVAAELPQDKPFNKPAAVIQPQNNQQIIQKKEAEIKRVDFTENAAPSSAYVDNIKQAVKPIDKSAEVNLTQNNLQKEKIDIKPPSESPAANLPQGKPETVPTQPNIENIQLKDLPVNDDTIDLRNL